MPLLFLNNIVSALPSAKKFTKKQQGPKRGRQRIGGQEYPGHRDDGNKDNNYGQQSNRRRGKH